MLFNASTRRICAGTCYVWRMMRGSSLTTHFEPLHKLRAHAGAPLNPSPFESFSFRAHLFWET